MKLWIYLWKFKSEQCDTVEKSSVLLKAANLNERLVSEKAENGEQYWRCLMVSVVSNVAYGECIAMHPIG